MSEARPSERLEQRLRTLQADLGAATQAEQAAGEHAREALEVGGDADAFIRERNVARTRLETLTETIEQVEVRLVTVRAAEDSEEARALMLAEYRAYMSLLHSYVAEDSERIELAEKARREAYERKNARYEEIVTRFLSMSVIHERFPGTPMPDVELPLPPARDVRVQKAWKQSYEVAPADPPRPPTGLSQVTSRSSVGWWSLRRVLERIGGTRTADLLERAGLGLLGDATAWDLRGRTEQAQRRDQGDATRRGERDRYDAWLQIRVSEPALVDALRRQAKEDGLRFERDRNHPGQSIRESADRLGVVGLEAERGGPVWWALPGVWDEARFSLLGESRRSLAGLR